MDAAGSEGASFFRWSFGDGEVLSSTDPLATHTWSTPGHYGVVLEVEGDGGRIRSGSVRVDVVWPLANTAPQSSGRLAASSGDSLLFVALPDFDRVAVVDPEEGAVVTHLSVCAEPVAVSHSPESDLLAVACAESGEVELWDTTTFSLEQTIDFDHGELPCAVVLRSRSELWVLTSGDGSLRSMRLPSGTLNWQATGLEDPSGIATIGDLTVVTRSRSPEDGGRWWWGRLEPAEASPIPFEPALLRLDLGSDSDTSSRGVPNLLGAPVLSPDGRQVVFPSLQSNNQAGLFRDGVPLTHETTARAVLSRVMLDKGIVGVERSRKIFDDRDFASSAAYSPRGDWIYVAMLGAGSVDVLDAYSFETVGSRQGVGQGLVGVWLDSGGRELWVLSELTRELIELEVTGGGVIGAEVTRVNLRPESGEVLTPEVLLGKQIFHAAGDSRMSKDGYLSCASCHPGGSDDGRVWDFTGRGEGFRNTTDLRGRAGGAHGPLHWSANFDEVQDFEGDIRSAMGGGGFLSDEDWQDSSESLGAPKAGRSEELDGLAAYLETLDSFPSSPHRNADGTMTEAAIAGQALFESEELNCSSCHPAPKYTDSTWLLEGTPLLHDVGTISAASGRRLGGDLWGVDTPTLRGVWASAPYFHDGAARTVRDVLEQHGHPIPESGGHDLSGGQHDQLEAFLLQLE